MRIETTVRAEISAQVDGVVVTASGSNPSVKGIPYVVQATGRSEAEARALLDKFISALVESTLK